MPDLKPKILLVDDDDVDAMLARRWARRYGWEVEIVRAHNGREALEILRGEGSHEPLQAPFLILLDLNMPVMGGIEFLRELRADPALKRSVVIVLTTSSHPDDVSAVYELNAAGYLVKSVDVERAGRLVGTYLEACTLPV